MRPFVVGLMVALLSVWLCTCSNETLAPEINEAQLLERLIEVKPEVARYMGVTATDVDPWRPRSVSPRTLEEAHRAGLDEGRVIDYPNPTNLRGGPFTWSGEVEFGLHEDVSSRVFLARCFYDKSKDLWELDKVNVRAPAFVPGEVGKKFLWLPVKPTQEFWGRVTQ